MAKGKYAYWLTPDGQMLLKAWARDGLADEQLAKNMGIAPSTLYKWKNEHKEISEALSRGKSVADIEVENALHKKALGYNASVKKTFKLKEVYYDEKDRRCEKEHLEEAIDEVHIPADTQAQAFWLKNRKPEQWRDKVAENDQGALEALDRILKSLTSVMHNDD